MSEIFYVTLTKLAKQDPASSAGARGRFTPHEQAELERAARRAGEEERPSLGTAAKGVAGLVAAKKLITHGAERALGVHRLIHGTSKRNAESILRDGFKDSFGASLGGSTANVGGYSGETFQAANIGRIHMFKDNPLLRRFAAGHAHLSDAGAGIDAFFPAILGAKRGGARLGAVVGDQFLRDNYEADPYHLRGAYRTAQDVVGTGKSNIGPERLTQGRAGLRDILKHRERGAALADYIKRNPGRFAAGLGMTAAGGLAAYRGARRLYRAARSRGKQGRPQREAQQ